MRHLTFILLKSIFVGYSFLFKKPKSSREDRLKGTITSLNPQVGSLSPIEVIILLNPQVGSFLLIETIILLIPKWDIFLHRGNHLSRSSNGILVTQRGDHFTGSPSGILVAIEVTILLDPKWDPCRP